MDSVDNLRPDTTPNAENEKILNASGLVKVYGSTRAVDDMSVSLNKGEVLGLVGSNGAGKSTLMRIISGVTKPSGGSLEFFGDKIEADHFSTVKARQLGIRVVYQELSLCTNLKVYENFYVEQFQRFRGFKWRKNASAVTKASLNEVFPGNKINPAETVSNLTISQRQMIEISRAACDPDLKLLILDEPTSSLGAEQVEQLSKFVETKKKSGVSFIFISHKLKEVLKLCDKITIMSNGKLICNSKTSDVDEKFLISTMSGVAVNEKNDTANQEELKSARDENEVEVEIKNFENDELHKISTSMYAGEVIGIAGLEGCGQKTLLHVLYEASRKSRKKNRLFIKDPVAYVSGDRPKEGVFPLWSILKNLTVTRIARFSKGLTVDQKKEQQWGKEWYERLKIKASDFESSILSLSGGNQQKVLIARAMLSEAKIIILDDPSRGVDVETKKQLAALYREAASHGKLVIWYSTEDEELTMCDRVLVMRDGHIVKELSGKDITKDRIIDSSFITVERDKSTKVKKENSLGEKVLNFFNSQRSAIPLIALVIIVMVIKAVNSDAITYFGLELMINSAIPLVLAGLSQMFIIAASDIDFGLGAYLGFTNVISATFLVTNPPLGILILLLGIIGYGVLAAIIHIRKIPAIVVTLGSSFIWLGIALNIMEKPGGSSPEWLSSIFNLNVPIIPEAIILVALFGAAAYFIIMRSKYGTILRGFGNNQKAIQRSGWSPLKARVSLYLLAGIFGVLAGMAMTGISTAADANAASILSIADCRSRGFGRRRADGWYHRPNRRCVRRHYAFFD